MVEVPGYSLKLPTGAAHSGEPFSSLSPRSPMGRRGTNTRRRVLAATACGKPAGFAPHVTWAKPGRTNSGGRAATYRQVTDARPRMNNKEVGRPGRPSPSLPPVGRKGGAAAQGDGSGSVPREDAVGGSRGGRYRLGRPSK